MIQSKVESIIETITNVGSGFILALLLWSYVVKPLYDSGIITNAFYITLSFTVISVLRGYFWRRFFARGFNKKVSYWVGKYYGKVLTKK